jgi:hypothetical protein
MTFAARALRAAWAMADGAVEERAPQNGGKIQGAGKDAVPFWRGCSRDSSYIVKHILIHLSIVFYKTCFMDFFASSLRAVRPCRLATDAPLKENVLRL